MTFVSWKWQNSLIRCWGSSNGSFTPYRLGVVRLVCYLILRKQLTVSTWKRQLPFFGPLFLWSNSATFYVGQVSWGTPEFLADLEAACKYQSEEGSQSTVGL